jgi:phosphoribosylglycinamide formyltransferase 1
VEARIAVLASGRGTNLQALLDDPATGPLVCLVASDQPDAAALERARSRGIPAEFVNPSAASDRAAYGRALGAVLARHDIELVALAGFMRILHGDLVARYEHRMLNMHPSLLPAFPGALAVRDALAWGVKVTGATVHFVDEEVDHGPIVLQEPVALMPGDDEASLRARIQEVEHRIYPAAVRLLVEGRLAVEGRTVRILDAVRR